MTINPLHISTIQSSTWISPYVKEESIVKSPSCTMFEDCDNEHNIKSDKSSSFENEGFDPKTQEEEKTQNIFFYSPYFSVGEHAQIINKFVHLFSTCVKEESSVKSIPCNMFEDHDNEHNVKSDKSSSFENEENDSKAQKQRKIKNSTVPLPCFFKQVQIVNLAGLVIITLANQILTGVVRLINFSVKCVTEIAFLSVHLIENLKFKIILFQNHQQIQTQVIHHHHYHYHYPNVNHIVSG